jgi:hypothetical protein
MQAQYQLVRLFLLLLSLFFAHFLGRTIAQVRQGAKKRSALTTWILRLSITFLGIAWGRHFDWMLILAVVLSALSLAWGMHAQRHPPQADEKLHLDV